MNEIMIALTEEKILKKIRQNKITGNKNIIYREAIIEILKKNKKISKIIISEKLPGDIDIIKLIKKIKKINKNIQIFIILYNKKILDKLIEINIKNIYYNNKISIKKLINKLKGNNKNIICVFGENEINKKIIILIMSKKLKEKNKKIVILNLKEKDKKNSHKIKSIKKCTNKYILRLNKKYKIKEEKIDKNILIIKNIEKSLKNENKLIKKIIIKNIIKKYILKNYYIILNFENIKNKKINKKCINKKIINYLVIENNIKNFLELNEKNINKSIKIIIVNKEKNNISKYLYKLKLKINKIKTVNVRNSLQKIEG